jgi:hypothetical protein
MWDVNQEKFPTFVPERAGIDVEPNSSVRCSSAVLDPLSLPEIYTPKAFTKVAVVQILTPASSAASAMATGTGFKFPLPEASSCCTCAFVTDEVANVNLSAFLPETAAAGKR